jgi:hypothetical protein
MHLTTVHELSNFVCLSVFSKLFWEIHFNQIEKKVYPSSFCYFGAHKFKKSYEQLTDNGGFQVDEDSPGDVFTSTSLAEECVEGVVTTSDGLVTGHLAIRLDSVIQAVQLPAGVTDLDTSLVNACGWRYTHAGNKRNTLLFL